MTSNKMAAAAALRRNITRTRGMVSVSLRSTRTSEVSSFVKNCNKAENFALRKELNIWHKDTNFAVRKVAKEQDDMYRALLKLSRTKKLIKEVKQDQVKDREELRRWIHSKRRIRRHVVHQDDNLQLRTPTNRVDDKTANDGNAEVLKISFATEQPRAPNREVEHRDSNPEHSGTNLGRLQSLTEINLHNHNQNRLKQNNSETFLKHASQRGIDCESAIEAVDEAYHCYKASKSNGIDVTSVLPLSQAYLHANLNGNEKSGENHLGLSASRPARVQRLKDTKFPPLGGAKALTEEEIDDSPNIVYGSSSDLISNDLQSVEEKSLKLAAAVSVKGNHPFKGKPRPRRKRIKLKSNRSEPTEELINNSSIAVRPGKSYDVTVYKKGESGDFEADVTSWNTTVDVAKYFHLSSRRERLKREKLLEDAREIEAQQRHRVDRFLRKLSWELETDERAKNYNREAEEAKLRMQRRLEALKRGPPKYGDGDLKSIPNYVRIYPRLTTEEKKLPRKIRKRSSWSVPSLFTLQIAAANPRLVPPIPGGVRNPPTVHDTSSHLVNINLDRYLLDVAKL